MEQWSFFFSETDEKMIKELSKYFRYVKLVEFRKSFQRWREIGSPEFKMPIHHLLPIEINIYFPCMLYYSKSINVRLIKLDLIAISCCFSLKT